MRVNSETTRLKVLFVRHVVSAVQVTGRTSKMSLNHPGPLLYKVDNRSAISG